MPSTALTCRALGFALVLSLASPAATLNHAAGRFDLDETTGAWRLTDSSTQVMWTSHPDATRFAEATFLTDAGPRVLPITPARVETTAREIQLLCHPLGSPDAGVLRIRIALRSAPHAFDLSYDADKSLRLQEIRLLDHAFMTRPTERGAFVVPTREGLLIPAQGDRPFSHRFDSYAYEGCHLLMAGFVKDESALLLTWPDPYAALEIHRERTAASVEGRPDLTASLILRESARSLRLQLLGKGDYNTVAYAYRDHARDRGLLVRWDWKLRENPDRDRYIGASNYKLWSLLDRRMNEDSTAEQSVRVNWTFDEAAQVAEHLKHDLQLDRVLFTLGGWIHRGYDNQHPDALPAAPECGGNEALAAAARRIRALGYVLSLHDNYQDIYRDAPSWDEKWVNKNRDGSLTRGGVWAGGRAYVTCARMALDLARRPQNLSAIHQLTGADSYFIDTTYASGLYECFDPHHPMTRHDDLFWKIALSDEARRVFGSFGSECGREWAIPHADFFEGITGVSGRGFHDAGLLDKLGAVVIPFFELVYHDTIAAYGKYGYDQSAAADYVRQHLILGRPLHYHDVPSHLYWKDPARRDRLALTPTVASLEPAGPREFSIRYRWSVATTPESDWRIFVHFSRADGTIVFQNDHQPATPMSRWAVGTMELGPFRVRVPDDAAGEYAVLIGCFDPASGTRAGLEGPQGRDRAVRLGTLRVGDGALRFEPSGEAPRPIRDPALFVNGDGGWTERMHPYDRFVKNTHELLGVFNAVTAECVMAGHEFLDHARRQQRSVFIDGDGKPYIAVINQGDRDLVHRDPHPGPWGDAVLPPGGLLAQGRDFVAFVAIQWNDLRYDRPTFFTLRSLDGQPLGSSRRVRVYHGFGDNRVRLGGRVFSVPREEILNLEPGN